MRRTRGLPQKWRGHARTITDCSPPVAQSWKRARHIHSRVVDLQGKTRRRLKCRRFFQNATFPSESPHRLGSCQEQSLADMTHGAICTSQKWSCGLMLHVASGKRCHKHHAGSGFPFPSAAKEERHSFFSFCNLYSLSPNAQFN